MRKIEWLILIAVAVLAILANLKFKDFLNSRGDSEDPEAISSIEKEKEETQEDKVPDTINVLVVGLDKSKSLADINMVAHLDTETNTVKLVSVPRDLFIDFREAEFAAIKEDHPKIKSKYAKLTEVYGRAGGKDEGLQAVKDVVEVVTGLEIAYVVSVDTSGFVDIVDAVGGVEFYVPQKMYYEDPYQDLYINLSEGLQVLDGDKAEQLVRFRKYKGDLPPDIQRIKVQQDFLKALSEKILATRNVGQMTKLATTCLGMVRTDMNILKIVEYIEYVVDQGVSELMASKDMTVIPTFSEKSTETGQWFEKWNPDEVEVFVADFIAGQEATATNEAEETPSTTN